MSDKRSYLLRIDPELHEALQRWSRDELRSLNSQIEYLLRRSLQEAGRLPSGPPPPRPPKPRRG
jgi:hypothetical protein